MPDSSACASVVWRDELGTGADILRVTARQILQLSLQGESLLVVT